MKGEHIRHPTTMIIDVIIAAHHAMLGIMPVGRARGMGWGVAHLHFLFIFSATSRRTQWGIGLFYYNLTATYYIYTAREGSGWSGDAAALEVVDSAILRLVAEHRGR